MQQSSPINPRILQWARLTTGLTIEEVVLKIDRKKVTAETVAAWETGEIAPTYLQLERLAYEVYNRPLALFFFPEPPDEETPRQAFRTLPDSEIQRLSPRIRFLLRRAKAMQINLSELYDGINPADKQLVRDLQFSLNPPVAELARSVREFLGIDLSEQLKWKSTEVAFKAWRHALESSGVFVFKDAFKDETVSGFCLHDNHFPLIYVNNSKPHTYQVFTLFHELAHLLSGTGGIEKPDETYISALRGADRRIEILCNRFAAAFLVPETDFDQRISQTQIDQTSITTLANQYSVSREVILRRLLDKELVSQEYYEQLVTQWRSAPVQTKKKGGDYYRTQGAYLGEHYMELVFGRLYQNRISVEQAADYLGVKTANISGIEKLLFSQEAAL